MAFVDTLMGLSTAKKIVAGIGTLLVILAMMVLVRTAATPPMALLYAGVDSVAAGEIITKLDAESVTYKVEGERIYVEAPARDRLRLTLAQQGLPRQSVVGYELLDDLSGFSTTSDMFSAAYWRAKEGEITRTLMTMPEVRAARVHIGADSQSVFVREQSPRTASVTVTAAPILSTAQVRAIQHVTALAVANLRPENVAVVDTRLGLLTAPDGDGLGAALDEDKRARRLESDLLRLVEARVGQGNARISVAMELLRQTEAISEQIVDPDSAIVTNRNRTEITETETGTSGAVTVASDLPDGDANQNADQSTSERVETREDLEYAVTTRDRRIERLPGSIERLTIAVLINQLPPAEGEDAPTPRAAEEIDALRTLIETAAGIDAARGDRVTIQAMAFDVPQIDEVPTPQASLGLSAIEPRLWQIGQLAFLGLIALILGLFVVKPILTQQAAPSPALAALEGEALTSSPDPIALLHQASTDHPDEAAALLNAWLEEEEAA